MITNNFAKRHNGPQTQDIQKMLDVIGVSSIDELIDKTIPSSIRFKSPLNLEQGMNEFEFISHMKDLASKNKVYKSYIGMGYYNTITPGVLQRNILENPGWYTAYTPYQAEISQGRLEALFNFQTTVCSLTAMPIANASMLDEATAAAEAMLMFFGSRSREQQKNNVIKFFVDSSLFPQNLEVIRTRAIPKGIELVIGNPKDIVLDNTFFGAILQYPNVFGEINDYREFTSKAKENNVFVAVIADILA
ncbi:MAG: glycine dehydrogenase (aminomethyl-transferring), partial [Bacteroidales bacterium]|nr:glycine dehydrogenase (aminomethyl-transferring) [Bacteroidales bacterium]